MPDPRALPPSQTNRRRIALIATAAALALAAAAVITAPAARAQSNIIDDGDVPALIAAIEDANVDPDADTITLAPNGTYVLDSAYPTTDAGLPVISTTITIEGNSATIRRDPKAPAFRILTVAGTGDAAGDLTLNDVTVRGGAVSAGGGGLYNDGGVVSIVDTTVSGNTASAEGYEDSFGGGLFNQDGTVTMLRCDVLANATSQTVGSGGGGLANIGGELTLTESTVSGNRSGSGGGLASTGPVTIARSIISDNEARGGDYGAGGIVNLDVLTITNTTVSGNEATVGGGIVNVGRMYVAHTTIVNNAATNSTYGGGGVVNAPFDPRESKVITFSHTLLAGNSADQSGSELWNNATVNADDHNLFGHSGVTTAGAVSTTTPITTAGSTTILATADGASPTPLNQILDPTLRDNGGRSRTHALVEGSPAVDAGAPAFSPPPAYDQRGPGFPRVEKTSIDIGAYEVAEKEPPQPVGGVTVRQEGLALLRPWLDVAVLAAALTTTGALLLRLRKEGN